VASWHLLANKTLRKEHQPS